MYSPQLERALSASLKAHAGQTRKGSDVPYAVHPAHIALILTRWGADEATVAAGLLHDVVEDCEDWDRARMEREFGPRVAAIVAELTEDKTRPWAERKANGVEGVPQLSNEAVQVKAADALHNLSTLRDALQAAVDPAPIWREFKGGRDGTLATKGAMVEALARRVEPRIARELRATFAGLQQVAAAPRV